MKIHLFDYQKKCIEWFKTHDGLILYHSMGSGKTITSLSMVAQFDFPIIIISTKASRKNFEDDIKKMGMRTNKPIQIFTYERATNLIMDKKLSFAFHSVIIDEAHRLRSGTSSRTKSILITELTNAKKIVLLTGTIFYNKLTDLSVLVNIIKREEVLPETSKEFTFFFWDSDTKTPTFVDKLKDRINGTISYYKKPLDDINHYPKQETMYIKVDMSNQQISEYRHYLKKILSIRDIQHIDYTVLDKRKVNNFLSVTRQLSNTVDNSPDSPKITKIFEWIKSNPKPIVVYSNYLNNGVLPLSMLLTDYKYALYFGEQSSEKRNKIIDEYNKGLLDVLLITSAGSESLDLKNTRSIHIMEPHWNESKIKQIIGRTIRYDSHKSLDVKERVVTVCHWISVFGYKISYETADEYLVNMSLEKEKMFGAFDSIVKECSI